jgi:hypothetical protein
MTPQGEAVKSRGILFKGPLVRAIIEGRKSQTRRIIKRPEKYTGIRDCAFCCPYGAPGDLLWVKETWQRDPAGKLPTCFRADGCRCGFEHAWRSPLFLSRELSRLTLRITDVRVQRLQEISEEDAKAEGVEPAIAGLDERGPLKRYRTGFVRGWSSIHGPESWARNDWVWAITFVPTLERRREEG